MMQEKIKQCYGCTIVESKNEYNINDYNILNKKGDNLFKIYFDEIIYDVSSKPHILLVRNLFKGYNFINLTIVKKEYDGDVYMPEVEHLFLYNDIITDNEEFEILHYNN